jgi:UDP-N-acetylmuramate: L-alanyl-gamma-D-glutamyl-meso-diaminopimelate ligase
LIFKPTLEQGFSPILSRSLGSKAIRMVYGEASTGDARAVRNLEVPEAERLNPDRLAQDIKDFGGTGWYLPGVPEIVDLVVEKAQPGDVLAVLSNGGFGGIHQKLLDRLAK